MTSNLDKIKKQGTVRNYAGSDYLIVSDSALLEKLSIEELHSIFDSWSDTFSKSSLYKTLINSDFRNWLKNEPSSILDECTSINTIRCEQSFKHSQSQKNTLYTSKPKADGLDILLLDLHNGEVSVVIKQNGITVLDTSTIEGLKTPVRFNFVPGIWIDTLDHDFFNLEQMAKVVSIEQDVYSQDTSFGF